MTVNESLLRAVLGWPCKDVRGLWIEPSIVARERKAPSMGGTSLAPKV